jgi:hypothetical protein
VMKSSIEKGRHEVKFVLKLSELGGSLIEYLGC